MAPRSTLTLFCGLPGSGKTKVARSLEDQGRGLRLCTDDWKADLGLDPDDGEVHELLQRRLYLLALDLLAAGMDVILEDGLWMRAERAEKFADARRLGAAIEWHVFDLDRDELLRRNELRNADPSYCGSRISPQDLDAMLAIFEPPTTEDLVAVDRVVRHR